jgi:hypothetical protein
LTTIDQSLGVYPLQHGHAGKEDSLSQNADRGSEGGCSSETTRAQAHCELARVDAQREKLTSQLNELEATERVLARRRGEPGAVVVTDAWGGYATLPDRGYRHLPVAAQGDPSVAEDFLPISHLIFSNLKSWLRGCHHGVSAQHLQAYLNEFTFRFNRRFYPFNAFRSLLGISGQAVAPTYDGLYTGSW